jgi:hypothetical protein
MSNEYGTMPPTLETGTIPPPIDETPGLSQVERLTNIIFAPSKTFIDIRDKSRSWWLPFLLFVIIGSGLFALVTVKVTWQQVYENGLRVAPSQAEKLDQLPADQKQNIIAKSIMGQQIFWAIAPIGLLIINLIAAGVLLGTINFVFGGKASYSKVLAVSWYAGLPVLFKLLIGMVMLLIGIAPEAFMPGNPAPTNLGFIFSPPNVSMLLWTIFVALDVISIWSMVLNAQGLAIVAGVKKSAGYIAVFGWWGIILFIQLIFAAFSS